MPRRPGSSTAPGRSAALSRALLAVLLLALVVLVAWRYPVPPREAWPAPQRFAPDAAACEAQREGRQWTRFTVPQEAGFATVAEVARKQGLEVAWLCRANGLDPDCGGDRLRAGDELVLPLHRQAVEPAARARRDGLGTGAGEAKGAGTDGGGPDGAGTAGAGR